MSYVRFDRPTLWQVNCHLCCGSTLYLVAKIFLMEDFEQSQREKGGQGSDASDSRVRKEKDRDEYCPKCKKNRTGPKHE